MTITATELLLYAFGLFVLFITPGPVWVAVIARAMAYGMRGVWPLGLGVALGDAIWSLVAIFGVSAVVAVYADFLLVLRWVAVVILVTMGLGLIWHASRAVAFDTGSTGPGHSIPALSRPGVWAGFWAGLLAVTANPKASLFYMGFLPGFFDFSQITRADVAAICATSLTVPLIGNLALGLFVGRVRRFLRSGRAVRRANILAGLALILVGAVIALT